MKPMHASRRTRSASVLFLVAAGLWVARSGELGAQQAGQQPESPITLTIFPHMGVSTTPAEVLGAVSATAGFRVAVELLTLAAPDGQIGVFVAARATALAVNEQRICTPSCSGMADLKMSYMATAEGGIVVRTWVRPYVFGFFGRATPVDRSQAYDPATRTYAQNSSSTWGAGGGFTLLMGRIRLQLEGRYRRDRRYLRNADDSFEFVFGVPLRSS